jgi:hypothetical protein
MPSHLQFRHGRHSTTSQRTFLARHPRQARAARRFCCLLAREADAAAAAYSEEVILSLSVEVVDAKVSVDFSHLIDFVEQSFAR